MQEYQEKEARQFQNHLKDLANKSYAQNIYLFSDFMGLYEQDLFHQMAGELPEKSYRIWGGKEHADRCMVRFGNPEEFGYEADFPIACIHVVPLNQKFAEELSHRDFLGALMNLGIERSTLGDIIVGEKQAYLFCLESMAEFICQHLTQVKHTAVKCSMTEELAEVPTEEPKAELLQVASSRADAVIAKVYRISREESLELFRAGKIFVDGKLCENNARSLKENETVNARGYGKFIYRGEKGETRKGKTNVEVAVFR